MARRKSPLSRVYGLLEPGPVVLLTTAHKGKANVMAMSWHNMLEFEPPLVGCVVSEAAFSFTARTAAMGVGGELVVPATSGHAVDQEFAAPMTGFRVRVTFALATHESVDREPRRRRATPRGRGRWGIVHDP